jgi:hypothetical protein
VFKDRNVSGLNYSSGQESGVTDAGGTFSCESGNDVAFSVGAVQLGQAGCASLVTPTQIATNDANFFLRVTNLARFLQMLDIDGDPDNGSVISDAVQQVATGWSQVDFSSDDLATELVTILSDVASVDGTAHELPGDAEAGLHLIDTLVCAYAGAYAGSFSGSDNGAAALVIGWQAPTFGFIPLAFEWLGVAASGSLTVAGGGSGSISIVRLPENEHTGVGLEGQIQATFETPDRILGTWDGGNLQFDRIGGDVNAERRAAGASYRLVGKASSEGFAAYLSVNLYGDDLQGEAFDVHGANSFAVEGTLEGNNATFTLDDGTTMLAAEGTLTIGIDDEPREILGTLDDGSEFSMAACRLN